ncbi:MAG: hypothetical protein JW825_02045 [Candidatus Methanofastidiosa archaeon]|nr:hypothetical protein [Candidatus Methanofastidiosa archaeon]
MDIRKFKRHEVCLIIDKIVHDESAIESFYTKANTLWTQMYLKDEDDKAVGVTLFFERLFVANQLASDYDETRGWKTIPLEIEIIEICYLLDSSEWRQLEDLEMLQLLLDLREGVYSENRVICFVNAPDLELLNVLIMYYYYKNLKMYIEKYG